MSSTVRDTTANRVVQHRPTRNRLALPLDAIAFRRDDAEGQHNSPAGYGNQPHTERCVEDLARGKGRGPASRLNAQLPPITIPSTEWYRIMAQLINWRRFEEPLNCRNPRY